MYLMGRQTRENLEKFRSFGGVQPYPSRTKDLPDVDLSTGSVGLGAAVTSFTSLTEEYLRGKGLPPKAWPGTDVTPDEPGRHIAIVGDAELDEGKRSTCSKQHFRRPVSLEFDPLAIDADGMMSVTCLAPRTILPPV